MIDEVDEKKMKVSVTAKALRNKDQIESTTANKAKSHAYPFHTSTVAAP